MSQWHSGSNYLILLSVPDEQTLMDYAAAADQAGIAYSLVIEPDIGDEATALALEPSEFNRRFSHLPLQGKQADISTEVIAA